MEIKKRTGFEAETTKGLRTRTGIVKTVKEERGNGKKIIITAEKL